MSEILNNDLKDNASSILKDENGQFIFFESDDITVEDQNFTLVSKLGKFKNYNYTTITRDPHRKLWCLE
jgi:hypothetical protein